MVSELELHYSNVISSIFDNKIVFFLGSGINMLDRPENELWKYGESNYLPNSQELITYLSKEFKISESYSDLIRVSQFASIIAGRGRLIDKLCDVFIPKENVKFYPSPNKLHKFFAQMPKILSKCCKNNNGKHFQLIVTTNYDDLLEQAFRNEKEPYDLITYNTHGENIAGKFIHTSYLGDEYIISDPNTYTNLPMEIEYDEANLKRTIILKIHGAINRKRRKESSFVITEDDYIEYLSLTRHNYCLLPSLIDMKLKYSNILFLGYSLRDWNMRAILHRIWKEQKVTGNNYQSWAIQLRPDLLDKKSWEKRDIEIIDQSLTQYIDDLKNNLEKSQLGGM